MNRPRAATATWSAVALLLLGSCGGGADIGSGEFTVASPRDGAVVHEESLEVRGTAPAGSEVVHDIPFARDDHAVATADGEWSMLVELDEGENELTFRLGDDDSTEQTLRVTYLIGTSSEPTVTPTLTPTPSPTAIPPPAASLEASSVNYTTDVSLGGSIIVIATVANSGPGPSEPIRMQFSDLKDYADIVECSPTCSTDEFLGDYFAQFAVGVPSGATQEFRVEFIATQIGAAHWSLLMYGGEASDAFFFGSATTAIH